MAEDNLIDSFESLRTKQWAKWRDGKPVFESLNEMGRRLFYRSGDLAARLCLNGEVMVEFDAKNFEGAAMLFHAERYLADRLAYELAPWPKGMVKIEPDDAYALPAVGRVQER